MRAAQKPIPERPAAKSVLSYRPLGDAPCGYIDALLAVRPTLASEHKEVLAQLGCLLWKLEAKQHRHRSGDGTFSISHEELRDRFGRGNFIRLNDRHRIFLVSDDWSHFDGLTRRFQLHADIEVMDERYCTRYGTITGTLTKVMMESGGVRRVAPRAIVSKDKRGNTAKVWRDAEVTNRVPVNLARLSEIHAYCGRLLSRESLAHNDRESLTRLRRLLARIIREGQTDYLGRGFVLARYQESDSGRLYGMGLSLQNVPKELRALAMQGLFDYDIANAHFSIFMQMADRSGFKCPVVNYYLQHKHRLRMQLAAEVGCDLDEIKECLIALMYGAHALDWTEAAIPRILGNRVATQRFKDHPWITSLRQELRAGRDATLEEWPHRNGGSYVNEARKSIAADANASRILAHLIQGAEAIILRAMVATEPDRIVLLQHDGFTATSPLDAAGLERAVYERTGYVVSLEERRISAPDFGQRTKTFGDPGRDRINSFGSDSAVRVSVSAFLPPSAPSPGAP
jgi:hypothetical protein